MTSIAENIFRTLTRVRECEDRYGRASGSVQLLAVSKTRPAADLREAYACGQRHFGENYLQDALDKIDVLADLPLCWHFIGPVQSNKTRPIAEHFDWVHSVDRVKVARRLSEQRPAGKAPLNICLQVNISDELSKSGISVEEAPTVVRAIADLPGVTLRGLMAIPRAGMSVTEQRETFARLAHLKQALLPLAPDLDTLSMGMSDDMEAAIAEGATMVRIGTALFGSRPPKA